MVTVPPVHLIWSEHSDRLKSNSFVNDIRSCLQKTVSTKVLVTIYWEWIAHVTIILAYSGHNVEFYWDNCIKWNNSPAIVITSRRVPAQKAYKYIGVRWRTKRWTLIGECAEESSPYTTKLIKTLTTSRHCTLWLRDRHRGSFKRNSHCGETHGAKQVYGKCIVWPWK